MNFWHKEVRYKRYLQVADQASALAQADKDVILLIMPQNVPKSLKFYCPCGCGELLTINLMPKSAKAWKLSFEREKGFSLWPSVWLDSGCKSHFILRRNTAWLLFGNVPEEGSTTFWDDLFRRADSDSLSQ